MRERWRVWRVGSAAEGHIDRDAVLERVIEAYDFSDPVLTNFDWPREQGA